MEAAQGITRRAALGGTLAGITGNFAAAPIVSDTRIVRLGLLKFGTAQWVAQVMRGHALDTRHGFTLRDVTLATTEAGRVALMAGAADVVVSDWMFVANQRALGTRLKFAPFSSATGGIVVPASSPIQALADLHGRKLGVAGGPLDKSWLIVRAAALHAAELDLLSAATPVYAAPPLLRAKLQQNELDAALIYWNFVAQLEAAGFRQVLSVNDCARLLGLDAPLSMVGFVFREDWAEQHQAEINGFLAAVVETEAVLAHSEPEWERIRPLMEAPDDALFQNLRRRFLQGVAPITAADEQRAAAWLFDVLLRTGGTAATGGLQHLPDGVFWRGPDG